jgi:hypothetical protein
MNAFPRGKAEPPVDASRFRFAALLTCLFLILAGVGACRHELWRDEMQAWLIARDVPDLPAVLEQAHYEGAPPLWILLLRPLALMTHRPEAMQILTWTLAGITIFLFCYFAPFNHLQKILLVSNYYLLFEYGIVCRNYLPGILLLSIACILYPSARERPWAFALSLIVAAMASVYSLIVAVAMAAAFWGSWGIHAFEDRDKRDSAAGVFHFLPLLAFAAGVGLAVYSMVPRPDTLYSPAAGWDFNWDPDKLAKVSWAFVSSHFPWPRPPGFFWIPSWHTPFPSFDHNWAFVLSLTLFGGVVLLLKRHLGALLFYLVGTLGISIFLYVKFLGFSRHTGFLFFTFLFAFWITKTDGTSRGGGFSIWMGRAAEMAFTAMLTVQAFTGLWAVREDFNQPFSCGKLAAQFLTDRHLQDAFMAVGPDWAGSPLAGYLNRSVYYPNAMRYGSFTHWDTQRIDNFDDLGEEEFFRRAAKEANGRKMVISLDRPFSEDFMQRRGIKLLAHVGGSQTPFEDYYLFFVPGETAAGK